MFLYDFKAIRYNDWKIGRESCRMYRLEIPFALCFAPEIFAGHRAFRYTSGSFSSIVVRVAYYIQSSSENSLEYTRKQRRQALVDSLWLSAKKQERFIMFTHNRHSPAVDTQPANR